jgi:siroheme synthase-like protein
MRYLPVSLDVQNQPCLVIGQGCLADEKALQLEQAGAHVLRRSIFDSAEGLQVFLIFAIAETIEEGRKIRHYAEENRILVNVVDQTENCNFIAPAILERGELTIAISTSGQCPALASHIRRQLEKNFGSDYASFLQFLAGTKKSVRKKLESLAERREFYRQLFEGGLLGTFQQSGIEKASEQFAAVLNQFGEE